LVLCEDCVAFWQGIGAVCGELVVGGVCDVEDFDASAELFSLEEVEDTAGVEGVALLRKAVPAALQ
jgi:hypothetical protein